jgi:hypothetical protein
LKARAERACSQKRLLQQSPIIIGVEIEKPKTMRKNICDGPTTQIQSIFYISMLLPFYLKKSQTVTLPIDIDNDPINIHA